MQQEVKEICDKIETLELKLANISLKLKDLRKQLIMLSKDFNQNKEE